MNTIRSTIQATKHALFERLFPAAAERIRALSHDRAEHLSRLAAWENFGTRAMLAQRWARAAAEHEPSQWRPMLSAYALAALLVDELDELEPLLREQVAHLHDGEDPVTRVVEPSPPQQVAIVAQAILEELRAVRGPQRELVIERLRPGARQGSDTTWDRKKLCQSVRAVVHSAYASALQQAALRLNLTPASDVSSGRELS
jgi:hypothetical protein